MIKLDSASFGSTLASTTAYVLIAANLIPLVGVMLFDWSLPLIMILYWLENVVIGVYTLVKMLVLTLNTGQIKNLFNMAFFCIHYGIFCSVHGAILLEILNVTAPNSLEQEFILLRPIELFQFLATTFGDALLLGLVALILSHGFSMFEHFFQRGEKEVLTINKLMSAPYPRILILHVTIIGGAMLIEFLGSPTYLLVLLVVIKIIVDVKLHQREHARNAAEASIEN